MTLHPRIPLPDRFHPQAVQAPQGWRQVPPARPFQFASLQHLEDAVEAASTRAAQVEGLQASTLSWWRDSMRSLVKFLREDRAEGRFLSGDAEQQLEVLTDWIAWLRVSGVSRVAVNTYFRGIASVLRRVANPRQMTAPTEYVKPPAAGSSLPKALTRDAALNVLRFVEHYPWRSVFERKRNLLIIGLMLLAGLRRGEVLHLCYADVDLGRGTLRILKGKGRFGGKDRTAYCPPQLRIMLEEYLDARRSKGLTHPELISSTRGNQPIGRSGLERLFALIRRETELEVSAHRLRHTYAILMRQAGVPDQIGMQLMGHSTLQMYTRYGRVFEEDLQRAAHTLLL